MSDFGTIITAKKLTTTSISSGELDQLTEKLKSVIQQKGFKDITGESWDHEFESAESNAIVRLSQYHYGDEDADEEREFVEEEELADAQELVEALRSEFSGFDFSAEVIEWWIHDFSGHEKFYSRVQGGTWGV